MKGALQFLHIIKIHASKYDCDSDGSSDVPTATDQDILRGFATLL